MSVSGFGDGFCKFFDVYLKNQLIVQGTPRIKVEINATVVGKSAFQYKFYSDPSFNQFTSENAFASIVNGNNIFQLDNPPQLYALGRFSLIPGSSLTISSLKINDVEHITTGTGNLIINSPALSFASSNLNQMYYFSSILNRITDTAFEVEFNVQNLLGTVYFEYLHYTDNTYTTLSYTTTVPVANGITNVPIVYTNLFVIMRFKIELNSSIQVSSFKIKEVEQFTSTNTFNSPIVMSEICFPSGALVTTDQGLVEIQKIDTTLHTIQQKLIVAITETYSLDESLVFIEKDAIRKHYPNVSTFISKKHKIYVKGKMKEASRCVGKYKGISLIPYAGEKLYNVLLEEYGIMKVNGLLCETLHPENPVAKLFRDNFEVS